MYLKNQSDSQSEPHLLILPNCTKHCPLQDFIRLTKHLITDNWEVECQIVDESAHAGNIMELVTNPCQPGKLPSDSHYHFPYLKKQGDFSTTESDLENNKQSSSGCALETGFKSAAHGHDARHPVTLALQHQEVLMWLKLSIVLVMYCWVM